MLSIKCERQEESADPFKKRRLVDIPSTTNSSKEAMSNEECVKEELICYLRYNQSEINSSPLKWWKCHGMYRSLLATVIQQ